MASAPNLCLEARVLVRGGLLLWLGAGLATVWEVLAMQGPDSPVRVGVLAGPIGQLRGFSFGLGAALLAAAWLWPHLVGEGRGRPTLAALVGGAYLHALALLYAASHGMVGVQVFDPRPDTPFVLTARALGHVLTLAGLASLTLRAFRLRS